ncbi:unnamed protein product [Hermetia illucens]|uniref:Disease resistance R13L4/SHOC-2-like LRR domain-containing protein n=1 Tax=Hermetia illucens TaxID=343691 RepID=A0A7R8UYG9_HERIL|nr:leucine-rich repeat-containing protein 1 [Hermetia illucens]CAD7088904.1 unnamed protein product [Hermetia illucens]
MNKTILHWSYHNLDSIPLTLLDYKELEEVYLKENFIASIPEWLLKLINLRFIHLLGNLIREIPENIYFLENLEFLDLSNNRLCSLPASIGKLVNLKRFSVGGNEIRVLPKDIGNLQNLEVLDLSANLFQQLPVEIARLRKLSEIVLNDNLHLRTLPNTLFLLPKLECICADRCGLLYLPSVLASSVRHVRLFNNRFVTHIPIVYLTHIQRFYDIIHYNESLGNSCSTHITVRETQTFRNLILSSEVRRVYDAERRIPNSLFEICLRKIGVSFSIPLDESISVPRSLRDTINGGPTAKCSRGNCGCWLYSEYYLLLVKRTNSNSKLIFSCPFCSIECMTKWKCVNVSEYYNINWNVI